MRNTFLDFKLLLFFCIFFISLEMHAQLGFCQGNSGDPIFIETFGSGTNYGPQLPAETTTYNFVGFNGPQDGEYTIGNNTFAYGWNMPSDHTPNDTNGKALIVNASFTSGEFYKTSVNGLCENTTYEFSSWLINVLPSSGCGGNSIPVNVQFEIWDITNTNLLASGATGSILGTNTPTWQQYGLVFQTLPNQTSIILKMINNGAGGCGNDLAIDDIVFKSCGDLIATEDTNNNSTVTICSSQTPYSETITAVPDNTVFSTHFYQWQESTDEFNWSDIIGEVNPSISIVGITSTTYYRAKVSEYQANLNNSDCITFSDIYEIIVTQVPLAPTTECWEIAAFSDITCSWTITGSQPTQPVIECYETATFNTITCTWEVTGTKPEEPTGLLCWQTATFNEDNCEWEITGTQPLIFSNEFLTICKNESLTLEALSSIENPTSYEWSSNELTQSITINSAGIYEVEITDGCNTEIITFNIQLIENPIIESVISDGSTIIVNLANEGYYLYSLNGIDYQFNNLFSNTPSNLYTIYVKSNECDTVITQEHLHFFIPKFMTPNADGVNDYFSLNVSQYFTSTEVYIFDRYGKLLYSAINRNVYWDGTFNRKKLPSSDYWYRIILDKKEFIGHFTLKH